MGVKRLITASIIVASILASIVILLFQVGADEQLMSTVLPRVNEKFGINVTYQEADASLTSLTLRNVQINKTDSGSLIAVVERIIVSFRVVPLFWGKLDITGIRIQGLDARLGRKAGGASMVEWAKLAKISLYRSSKNIKGPTTTRALPKISLVESKILIDDGRFSLTANDISGRAGGDFPPAFDVGEYRIRRNSQPLFSGHKLVLKYDEDQHSIDVDAQNPTIEIPKSQETMAALALDASKSIVRIRSLSKIPITNVSHNVSSYNDSRQTDKTFNLSINNGVVRLRDTPEKKDFTSFKSVNGNIRGDSQGVIVANISGQPTDDNSRFSLDINVTKDSIANLKIAIPETSLGEFSNLLPTTVFPNAKDAYVEGNLDIQLFLNTYQTKISGNLNLSGLTIFHKTIASTPLENLNFQVEFNSIYTRSSNSLFFEKLIVTRNLATVQLTGNLHLDKLNFDLRLSVPTTPCKQLLASIPSPLRKNLSRIKLGGLFKLYLHLAADETNPNGTLFDAQIDNGCYLESFGSLPDSNFFNGPFSYVAYTAEGEEMRLITGPGTDRWTPLHFISPYIIESVITTEDGGFWQHRGVTLPEARMSIVKNLQKKSLKHGASTITMQLAKNLFLTRERTIARKFQELFYVWHLETHFQKREILELYLNIVEFGPSIYGIRDAAGYFFGREPSELSLLESIFIAKLLPAPIPRHAIYRRGFLSERNLKMLRRALSTMHARNRITDFEYKEALRQDIIFHKQGDPIPASRPPVRRLVESEKPSHHRSYVINSY